MAGSAAAASYPPALGCGVSGLASAGSGVLQVRGVGFSAGSRVLIRVAGATAGATRADAAGSFEGSWLIAPPAAGATVTAADRGCLAIGALAIENQQPSSGQSGLPPIAPGPGPTAGKSAPAQRPRPHPSASPTRPEPMPPARQADPAAAVIPSIPLTSLPPQLFLGLAGAVMVAGAALTGLTGRLGHRGHRTPRSESAVARRRPITPDTA
jgi:hypothetical protein